jgi:hypothetical protein
MLLTGGRSLWMLRRPARLSVPLSARLAVALAAHPASHPSRGQGRQAKCRRQGEGPGQAEGQPGEGPGQAEGFSLCFNGDICADIVTN